MKIGVGIDTGGTYTDAVVFDFESRAILETSKALTTKEDLSRGILEALDALSSESLEAAELISLSTTLATNACVEDRGGNAKLIFFGGDPVIIDKYGNEYGLPPSGEMYIQESYTRFSGEIEREPDWDLFCSSIVKEFQDVDGVGIIEMFAMKNSAVVEKKAKELFLQKYNIPVVCGHELFNELNCLQRGSSALLNARLFPIIQDFINAIKAAMARRGINATVVIVRSDGSLMSEAFAHTRPIETLLCGPAASVMGSAYFTKGSDSIAANNSVVVDMGGTTTDLALINNGLPHKVTDGISIGKWKTFVDGLYIKTFGLGGDSAVHYNEKRAYLEDYRVVPLCVAAAQYPYIAGNLKSLHEEGKTHMKFLHEHYMLVRDITDSAQCSAQFSAQFSDEEKMFCAALKDGPLILTLAAASVPGKDIYNLNVSRLVKAGVVQICGLTPTDIMHIKGDFNQFSSEASMEASMLGAQYVASNLEMSVEELCDCVYDEVKRKLYVNIVKVLLENKDSHYMKNGVGKDVERFINESYDIAKTGRKHDLVSMLFTTGYTLTGLGAPIRIFLNDVARMLETKAVFPKHHEVANALGAIVGNIYVTNVVEIRPEYSIDGITGYTVFGNTETKVFKGIEEAEDFAVMEAKNGAHSEAVRRGAQGDITVSCRLNKHEAEARDCMVYLGTKAIAHAVGSIGF